MVGCLLGWAAAVCLPSGRGARLSWSVVGRLASSVGCMGVPAPRWCFALVVGLPWSPGEGAAHRLGFQSAASAAQGVLGFSLGGVQVHV